MDRYVIGDRTLRCVDCRREFAFTVEEQRFQRGMGFAHPLRCAACLSVRPAGIALRPRARSNPTRSRSIRAPPVAVEALAAAGVRAVWLANNHALDYGETALLDTFRHLEAAGIAWAGAGRDLAQARRGAVIVMNDLRLGLVGLAGNGAQLGFLAIEADAARDTVPPPPLDVLAAESQGQNRSVRIKVAARHQAELPSRSSSKPPPGLLGGGQCDPRFGNSRRQRDSPK